MTKGRRRKALTWFLSGVSFVIVLASASCASKPQRPAPLRPIPSSLQGTDVTFEQPDGPYFQRVDFQGPPPSVNVYGELNGVVTPVTRAAGELGFQQHTFLEEGYDGDVAVSPDGNWLTFSSTRHHVKRDIYLQRTQGLSVTQLTNDDADDAFPVFSPDGSRIAFCSTRAGNWDIYLMDSDGRNVTQLTSSPSQDMHPSFSPDGKRLVYCSLGVRSRQWELWTVDVITNQKRMIGLGLFPSWSPDSSRDRIAFQKPRTRGSRWFSLWTIDLFDGEARNMTEIAASTNAAVVSPVWSPDGKRLAFSTIVEPAKNISGNALPQQDVWIINSDGTNRQRVTDGRGSNAAPFWGSDNRIYFISDRGGNECIWSTSAGVSGSGTLNAKRNSDPPHTTVGSSDAQEIEN